MSPEEVYYEYSTIDFKLKEIKSHDYLEHIAHEGRDGGEICHVFDFSDGDPEGTVQILFKRTVVDK